MTISDSDEALNQRPLRIMRVLFFFQYAGFGVFVSFLNVYLHDAGLSGTQIGLISMLAALFGMVGATLWGYLSDRTARPRLLLMIGALGVALVTQLYPYMPSFVGLAICSCLYGLFNAASSTLVDSLALSFLGSRREEYGRYRLGGSFGYILATSVGGMVFQRVGLVALFPTFGLINLAFIITAAFLPRRSVQLPSIQFNAIVRMMRQPVWLYLIVTLFLIWLATSGSFSFLNVTLKNMGGSDSLVGFVFTTSAVIEIPFMAFSGAFIRRFGARRLLWIGTAGYALRFFLYSQMATPEWALGISAIAGPMYVLFWNSIINVANTLAPPGMAATAQGLVISTTGLAGVVGAILSGWLFDRFGSTGLFLTLAAFCLLGFLVYSFGQFALQRRAAAHSTALER